MRSLTKTWSKFNHVQCNINNCYLTHRMFLQKLESPDIKQSPLYLAVNSLSGAIDILDNSEGTALKLFMSSGDCSHISERLLKFLKERGYIFPSAEMENMVFDTIITHHKNRIYFQNKILGYFAIDMACPMKCEYCFEKKYERQGNSFEKSIMDETSIDEAFHFLNLIKELQEREVDFVAGWGGEPLQEKNKNINKYFIEKAKENGFPIAYFSNLAFLGPELIDTLRRNASYFKFIQTTLDSLPEKHNQYRGINDAFERTVMSISRLLDLDLPVIVRTNVGAHNINDVPYLAEFYEKQGWFKYPKFKGFITHVYDRHHEFTKTFTGEEEQMLSCFLHFRDKYQAVRKIQGIKFAPSLSSIMKAFELRETCDITQENFEVAIKPIISYCVASSRAEYVFTGNPDCSVYNCAECTGLSKFKIGTYHPQLKIENSSLKMWGMQKSIYDVRSILSIEKCRNCKAATFCGGYCALEAIALHGNASNVCCKHADKIISDFLKNESARLYKRAMVLLEKTENLSL